jgi:hypothetical protein
MLLSIVLVISGAFVTPAQLTSSDIAALPHVAVTAVEHDGSTSHYNGVTLASLLQKQGALTGEVRGKAAASYVAVKGSDGYVAIFALAELVPKNPQCAPILADQRNGAPIGTDIGPLHVVAPCDAGHSRWVRNVVALTIATAP